MSYGVGLRNGVAFALGTIPSLTSGGGLRPSLLLNFLSGTLDSRITFSRGTQATQYTSNGTLQYAPNNLLTYSNQADNAAWTKSNSFVQTNLLTYSQEFDNGLWSKAAGVTIAPNVAIAPDGTSTADNATFATGGAADFLRQTTSMTVGVIYTVSVYAKTTGSSPTFYFDIGNGGGGTSTAQTPTSSWQRFTFTFTFAGANNWVDIEASAAGTISFWGAQLVQGSVPGDYRATTSAALPVLYADYNGVVRARKLTETTAFGTHVLASGFAVNNGSAVTLSCKLKAGERTFAALYAGGVGKGRFFNLSAGTVGGALIAAPDAASITSLGNGWYLCSITVNTTANDGLSVYISTDGTTYNYTGDGSSGIYIADAQLEAGSTVQAYNDTTTAAYYGPRFDYDPSSLVAQNLLTYSEQFDNAIWNKSASTIIANAIAAPNGTLTADKLVAIALNATHSVAQSGISSTVATLSFYAKAAEETVVSGWLVSASLGAVFDLSTGTATLASATSCGMDAVGNGWYRCWVYASTATTNGFIYLRNGAGYLGDGFSGVYIWGAQINRGSSMLPYTATTTAPYTLVAARGLLIEEQRVNLLLQSNDFQTSWTPTNITRTLASTTGPDGTLSGVKIEATATTTTALYQQLTSTSTSHTFAVYVKQGTSATTANNFLVRNITTLTNLLQVTFNYNTGVATYIIGSTGAVVTNVGNGWWRLQLTVTAGITIGDLVAGYVGFTGGSFTAGDFLYAYGAQLEAGAFATSYIPTVASQVTRSADSASVNTLTPWFNAAAGTMFGSAVRINSAAPAGGILEIGDGTSNNRFLLSVSSPTPDGSYIVTTGGVAQATITVANGFLTNTLGKIAATYALNDFQQASNAVLGTADTLGTLPTVTTMYIGRNSSGSQWNGWIGSINYYPTRLPNATLQALTV